MASSTAPAILSAPRVVGGVCATLGEGLCWSPREQALYWVDILEGRLYRDGAEGHREWTFEETISAVAERRDAPGLAVTLQRGLALFEPENGRLLRRDEPETDRPGNRFNDGKCDSRGRFWGGTMDFAVRKPTGDFWRFDAEGRATRALELGWIVTNGPAWTLDERTMFVNDTVGQARRRPRLRRRDGYGRRRARLAALRIRRRPSGRHDHRRRRPPVDRPLGRRVRHLPRPGDGRRAGPHRAADRSHHERRLRRPRPEDAVHQQRALRAGRCKVGGTAAGRRAVRGRHGRRRASPRISSRVEAGTWRGATLREAAKRPRGVNAPSAAPADRVGARRRAAPRAWPGSSGDRDSAARRRRSRRLPSSTPSRPGSRPGGSRS